MLLNPSIDFFVNSAIIFFRSVISVWDFLVFLKIYLLTFSLCSYVILLTSVSVLMIIILNSLSSELLISGSLSSVSGIFLVLLFATLFYFPSVSVASAQQIRHPYLCVLMEYSCVGDEAYCPVQPKLLISLKLLWLSEPPSLFLVTPSSWGCAKTCLAWISSHSSCV